MVIKKGPTWDADVKLPGFPGLEKDIECDTVIIGGGITGITSAYLLSQNKKAGKVVLIDKGKLCFGATGVTTAFLTEEIDTDVRDLIKAYGKDNSKSIRESHARAIDWIESTVRKEKINCEFTRCSNFYFALDEDGKEELIEEVKAGKSIGIKNVFKESNLGFKNKGYLQLDRQGKFHPLKYLSSLVKISKKKGIEFFENTEAKSIEKLGNGFFVKTPKAKIFTKNIIVATYVPFDKRLHFKKGTYTSYVLEAKIPKGIIKEGIYEDYFDPYHYFRIDPEGKKDRIIIGGEDHRSDIPVKESRNFMALEDYLKNLIPGIKYEIVRKWKGPITEPVDGLAFIGQVNKENIFYTTGFSGNGMTYGTIAARIITSKILGKRDKKIQRFAKVYDARRIPTLKQLAIKSLDYTRELINGAVKNTFKYWKS